VIQPSDDRSFEQEVTAFLGGMAREVRPPATVPSPALMRRVHVRMTLFAATGLMALAALGLAGSLLTGILDANGSPVRAGGANRPTVPGVHASDVWRLGGGLGSIPGSDLRPVAAAMFAPASLIGGHGSGAAGGVVRMPRAPHSRGLGGIDPDRIIIAGEHFQRHHGKHRNDDPGMVAGPAQGHHRHHHHGRRMRH
jgi:hypothetical protein